MSAGGRLSVSLLAMMFLLPRPCLDWIDTAEGVRRPRRVAGRWRFLRLSWQIDRASVTDFHRHGVRSRFLDRERSSIVNGDRPDRRRWGRRPRKKSADLRSSAKCRVRQFTDRRIGADELSLVFTHWTSAEPTSVESTIDTLAQNTRSSYLIGIDDRLNTSADPSPRILCLLSVEWRKASIVN